MQVQNLGTKKEEETSGRRYFRMTMSHKKWKGRARKAEETMEVLLAANQESESKGKALRVVVRQINNDLSSSKGTRHEAETERDELTAKLEAREEIGRDEFSAKISGNSSEGEGVGLEDPIIKIEANRINSRRLVLKH